VREMKARWGFASTPGIGPSPVWSNQESAPMDHGASIEASCDPSLLG